jgi:hypothetical protein
MAMGGSLARPSRSLSKASLQPITEQDLPALAGFLERAMRDAGFGGGRDHHRDVLLERLRWRLVRNPARSDDVPFGECVRSAEGAIIGSLVYTPVAFRLGEERLLGMNSGYFFTAPEARGWGMLLLRRPPRSSSAPRSRRCTRGCRP